jgi:hypothetical protein
MKIHPVLKAAAAPRHCLGMTLPEIMISMTLMVLVMGTVIGSNIIGMRIFQLSKAKLGASDEARASISHLLDEIRSCKTVDVGNGGPGSFVEITDGNTMRGGAIRLFSTTNSSPYIIYYRNNALNTISRYDSATGLEQVILNAVTNTLVFTSETYAGTVLTNSQNNRVIGIQFQFNQLLSPTVAIGNGGLFDYYNIRSKITRRVLE